MINRELKSQLKALDNYDEFCQILHTVDINQLDGSDFHFLSKYLNKIEKQPKLKVAFSANYTVEPLPSYIDVYSAFHGMPSTTYIGGYNQHYQDILNPGSQLLQYQPNICFLLLSLHELEPLVCQQFSSLSDQDKQTCQERILTHIENWVDLALQKTDATVLVSNFQIPTFPSYGIADLQQDSGELEFYIELNLKLCKKFKHHSRAYIFDIDRLASRFGKDRASDPKMLYMAKMLWTDEFFAIVANEFIRYAIGILGRSKKCLVLDLDNTLWGGVIGEDGIEGIKIGIGDPISEAFLAFQQKIVDIKNRGVILAICSKNNPDDALEAFQKKAEMPLKIDDFSASEINWDAKHLNIQKIAKTLNIGTDSLVFIDDNPAECSLVQQMLPEVTTILLPPDSASYVSTVDQILELEKLDIRVDDLIKTEQYIQNKKRQQAHDNIGDLNSYLYSLESKVTIKTASEQDLSRVHQLFSKTNQFNLTTIRYSVSDIEKFHQSDTYQLITVAAQDKFGQLGTIGQCLLKLSSEVIEVDSFILSCRAMGRGIETALINFIKKEYLIGYTSVKLVGTYIPSKKNLPIKSFLEAQGLKLIDESIDGKKHYELLSKDAQEIPCPWLEIIV